jgi:hypothetical protein
LCLSQLRIASEQIPIFRELRYLDPTKDFKEFLYDAFRAYELFIDDEFFDYYAKSGRFVLLLDAFDEVPVDAITTTIYALEKLIDQYPHLQVFVTSRPASALHRSTSFKIVKLAPLDPSEHQKFLERLLGEPSRAKKIATELKKSPNQIQTLLTTPLLMTLLAVIYNADQSIPQNEAEFYQRLFDVLLYRHDRTKLGFRRQRYTQLGEHQIQELFQAFCFFTRQSRLGVLTPEQFVQCLSKAMKNTGLSVDPDKFKDEIVKVACLLQEEGFSLHFIHKSVQEFYASAFIIHSPEKVAQKFYSSMHDGHWHQWSQEIRFLSITDKYRFNRFFLRKEMEVFAERFELTRDRNAGLRPSERSVRIYLYSLLAKFSCPPVKVGQPLTPQILETWRPLRSMRVSVGMNITYAKDLQQVVLWGSDADYVVEIFDQLPVMMSLWNLVNNASIVDGFVDDRLLELFRSGTRHVTVEEGFDTIELNVLELVELLGIEGEFAKQFEGGVKQISMKWQESEDLISVYEGRIDIIEA